ncbi:hypothetical protein ISN44_As06g015100 [Arabidopsis suecica]|uniref:Uncharacterized protein n=1 Tax=Arabidopsis suecica TaxID=45249 RepID=A0A8T2CFN8_ARASU|nr:hypothetical protein ISN44_As06g015100 [Arabidopsis suecica]
MESRDSGEMPIPPEVLRSHYCFWTDLMNGFVLGLVQ